MIPIPTEALAKEETSKGRGDRLEAIRKRWPLEEASCLETPMTVASAYM
jgi:hypothetical protein